MEISYPWGGISAGDAAGVAPYSAKTWSDIWSMIFNHDHRVDGVITTDTTPFDQLLRVFVSAGVEVYVSEGKALVDGTVYMNNAPILVGIPGPGYYSVVLHKDKTAQTVRAQLRPAGVTQTDDVWEINLADVTNIGGTVSAIDRRRFINTFPKIYKRQGGSASDWGTSAGTVNYDAFNAMVISGSIQSSMTASSFNRTEIVTFSRAFSANPLVIVNGRMPFQWPGGVVYQIEAVATTTNVTFLIKRSSIIDGAGIYMCSWIAIGPG